MRRQIERRRLLRMLSGLKRAATEAELARLSAMCRLINSKIGANEYFIGMQSVSMTNENVGTLDLLGYGMLLLEGLQCHLARIPTPACEEADPAERRDSVLLVLPNNTVVAVDRVLLHDDGRKVLFDGTLCLRKIEITEEENVRIKSAWNPHQRDYLEYYAYKDEAAFAAGVDVTCDAHQSTYDAHYELVYAATTCLFAHARQINIKFIERCALIQGLTETQVVQDNTTSVKKRLEALRKAVEYAGGPDKFVLTVFLNPVWRTKDARIFMRAIPSALHGIHIVGVTFFPAEDEYTPMEMNPKVLEFSSQATVTFAVLRDHDGFQLRIGKQRSAVEGRLCLDNVHETRIVMRGAEGDFIECVGKTTAAGVEWHPLRTADGVQHPCSAERYALVLAALGTLATEDSLVQSILTRQQRAAQ